MCMKSYAGSLHDSMSVLLKPVAEARADIQRLTYFTCLYLDHATPQQTLQA